jgi:hypothetical protein
MMLAAWELADKPEITRHFTSALLETAVAAH